MKITIISDAPVKVRFKIWDTVDQPKRVRIKVQEPEKQEPEKK